MRRDEERGEGGGGGCCCVHLFTLVYFVLPFVCVICEYKR